MIDEVKFSPNGRMLAAGSHDNYIDIYSTANYEVSRALGLDSKPEHVTDVGLRCQPVRRLKGHTSYVTHLDWSKDSRVLQSNCGAYEIIWWDVKVSHSHQLERPSSTLLSVSCLDMPVTSSSSCQAGAMMTSTRDSVEANTDWATWTCVLGFPVMGIWQPDTDGTDVNSVDR